MNPHPSSANNSERKRRYIVHLFGMQDEKTGLTRFTSQIRLWSFHANPNAIVKEHHFADECELIETVNPLLSQGSDVRDVLGHIESSDGFIYLLNLSPSQAATLGWLPS